MGYIRIKKISGNPYAYLCSTISTPKGPRQKVGKYLGRVHEMPNSTEISREVAGNNRKKLLQDLIIRELEGHGFISRGDKHVKDTFSFQDFAIRKGNKSTVLKLSNGYLCDFTVSRIRNFKRSKNIAKDAKILATYFHQAGILISQEEFIRFYQS